MREIMIQEMTLVSGAACYEKVVDIGSKISRAIAQKNRYA